MNDADQGRLARPAGLGMMGAPVSRLRPALAALAIVAAAAGPASAVPATGDRPAGTVSDWSHELNQNELPQWRPATAPPIPPRRWFPLVRSILHDAGSNGLWFSGPSALPFPPLPAEPQGAGRVADAGHVLARVRADRPALGRRVRGVGGPEGARPRGRRRRPHRRPDRVHPAPVAARPALPRGGAPRDPPDRPRPARPALRAPLHRVATSRSRSCRAGRPGGARSAAAWPATSAAPPASRSPTPRRGPRATRGRSSAGSRGRASRARASSP